MKKIIYILLTFHISLLTVNAQWVFQNSGTTQHLYDIFFIDKNTGWACGNNSTILKTTNGGLNWLTQQAGNIGYRRLNSIYFININTGYIAGVYNTLLKSTNGGDNWIIIRFGTEVNGNSLWDISFINENTGWISGEVGAVFRTTNEGLNWDSLNCGSIGILYNIKFLNENTGYGCGGYVRKTTDGGNTWQVQVIGTFAQLSMDFISTEIGWCVGEQDNKVFKTTNGGNNWDLINILPGGNFLQYSYCIKFVDSLTGWIGGTYDRIFCTTDGGYSWYNEDYNDLSGFVGNFSAIGDSIVFSSFGGGFIKKRVSNNIEIVPSGWTIQPVNTVSPFKDIFMIDSLIGWAVGVNDTVYYTTNSGTNWMSIFADGYHGFWSVTFVNQYTGWLTGKNGLVIKTTNGGSNWINQSVNNQDWVYSSDFISVSTGWVTMDQGFVRRTSNGGLNWTWHFLYDNRSVYSVSFVSTEKGWISCAGGAIYYSTDSGINWILQNSGTTEPLLDIFFLNDSLGFCAGGRNEGIILKTTNGGYNWVTIWQTTQKLNTVYFATKDTGWAAGDSGVVLFTSNSGVNWIKQKTGHYNNFYSVKFLNSRLGWILGGYDPAPIL